MRQGAERNILDGDVESENSLIDGPFLPTKQNGRNTWAESLFEYGSRAGIYRLIRCFDKYGWKFSVNAAVASLLKNPEVCRLFKEGEHEVTAHGYNWRDFYDLPLHEEKAALKRSIEGIVKTIGKPPVGHNIVRESPNTRSLISIVHEEMGIPLLYNADSYADDIPYWVDVKNKPGSGILMVPYTMDCNDCRFVLGHGAFVTSEDFLTYLKDSFDVLYEEGTQGRPKMMTVALHAPNHGTSRPS